jgi:hypothetical protein
MYSNVTLNEMLDNESRRGIKRVQHIVPAERKAFFAIASLLIDPSLSIKKSTAGRKRHNDGVEEHGENAPPADLTNNANAECGLKNDGDATNIIPSPEDVSKDKVICKEDRENVRTDGVDAALGSDNDHVLGAGEAKDHRGPCDSELRAALDVANFEDMIPESKREIVRKLRRILSCEC